MANRVRMQSIVVKFTISIDRHFRCLYSYIMVNSPENFQENPYIRAWVDDCARIVAEQEERIKEACSTEDESNTADEMWGKIDEMIAGLMKSVENGSVSYGEMFATGLRLADESENGYISDVGISLLGAPEIVEFIAKDKGKIKKAIDIACPHLDLAGYSEFVAASRSAEAYNFIRSLDLLASLKGFLIEQINSDVIDLMLSSFSVDQVIVICQRCRKDADLQKTSARSWAEAEVKKRGLVVQ